MPTITGYCEVAAQDNQDLSPGLSNLINWASLNKDIFSIYFSDSLLLNNFPAGSGTYTENAASSVHETRANDSKWHTGTVPPPLIK